jgi:hypothetical protein
VLTPQPAPLLLPRRCALAGAGRVDVAGPVLFLWGCVVMVAVYALLIVCCFAIAFAAATP